MQRRSFLTASGATLGFLGLRNYLSAAESSRVIAPYGPLVSDPKKLLDLPEGFTYRIISRRGSEMSDGLRVPGMPDGMACFKGKGDQVILVRNHELGITSQGQSPFPNRRVPDSFDRSKSYDHGERGEAPHIGGTSTIVYDLKKNEVEGVSLACRHRPELCGWRDALGILGDLRGAQRPYQRAW